MQGDGNLVLYAPGNVPVWHIGANGRGGTRAVLQSDGNFVVYTATGGVVWHTNTPTVPAAAPLWSTTTALQVSGSTHSVTIPNLQDGKTYRVVVNGIDAGGRSGPTVSCEITVDTQRPGTPTVESVAGDGLVVYPENQVAGGPQQAGGFRFGPGASTDVVSYLYGIDGDDATIPINGSNPTLQHAFDASGPHSVTVRSVDRAGNTSLTARTYSFWVQNAPTSGRWALDENSGFTAADTSASSQPLTLSSSMTWGPGAAAVLLESETDRALVFDGAGDVASSANPVVATNLSYSVMAFVRLDDLSVPRTAVSQDGAAASGFELGYRTSGCPGSASGCWAFTVTTVDGSSPAPVVIASGEDVVAGRWVQLTAVRDVAGSQSRLYVCDLGTADEPGNATLEGPVAAGPAPALTWNAAGKFRLGQGLANGAPANRWLGAVSGVQVWEGLIDGNEALRVGDACQHAEIPALLPQP
jgi:hypothetical protein